MSEKLASSAEEWTDIAVGLIRACGASGLIWRRGNGEWLGFRPEGEMTLRRAESLSHALDFGLIESVPAAQLARIASPSLERRPRLAGMGLLEMYVYLESEGGRQGGLIAISYSRPPPVGRRALEQLARGLFTLDNLIVRVRGGEETLRLAQLGRNVGCAVHDLRHLLTLAGLELERSIATGGAVAVEGVRRAQSDLLAARALCEESLASSLPAPTARPVRLAKFLRDESLAAVILAGRGDRVRIEVLCPEDLEIQTERATLGRLVRNLLLNAIEASPDGSAVEVEAHLRGDGGLTVCVRDQGRGMPQAEVEHLLRFGRSARGGAGIGTASSQSCARRLGGALEIETRLFAGTCARLQLPSSAWRASPVSRERPLRD